MAPQDDLTTPAGQRWTRDEDIPVRKYSIDLCDACIDGLGEECHTPGCALWIHDSPGIPISVASYERCRLLDNYGHKPKPPLTPNEATE